MFSRQDAKHAKQSINLLVEAFNGSGIHVLHVRLAKSSEYSSRLSPTRKQVHPEV
ncbi:MAG: hypothetical protein GWN84_26910 [Gammaproteobacteria bacterium]|nr:hypothetical protein [Gammaproteobacteria bacterium]NIV21936.1 hypothetical protein [Gammaproteobacteria bacterium]NIX11458.1 hypothetical protein [Gammaproteobacteria bacterium]